MDLRYLRERLQLGTCHFSKTGRGQAPTSHGTVPSGDKGGSSGSSSEAGHRTGSGNSTRPRVLLHVLPKAEEIRGSTTDPQSEASQSAPEESAFQNGPPRCGGQRFSSGSMGGVHRPIRCLSTCSPEIASHGVSTFRNPGVKSLISVLLPLFRAGNSPTSFYQTGISSRRLPQEAGGDHLPVLGRLVDCAQRPGRSVTTEKVAVELVRGLGIPSQFPKIGSGAISNICVPGGTVQFDDRPSGSISRQNTKIIRDNSEHSQEGEVPGRRLVRNTGHHGFVHRASAICQASHASNSALSAQFLASLEQECTVQSESRRTSETPSTVVDNQTEHHTNYSFSSRASSVDSRHGCQPVGLGRLPDWRSIRAGPVEGRGSLSSYQQSGNGGCELVSAEICINPAGADSSSKIRQHDSGVVCEQTRGDTISESVHAGMGPATMVQNSEHC